MGKSKSLFRLHNRWITEDQNDRVSSQEHFTDDPILVHRLHLLLSLARSRDFSPHLGDIFQYHVAVPIEGFDSSEQFFVVATVDEDLRVIFDGPEGGNSRWLPLILEKLCN